MAQDEILVFTHEYESMPETRVRSLSPSIFFCLFVWGFLARTVGIASLWLKVQKCAIMMYCKELAWSHVPVQEHQAARLIKDAQETAVPPLWSFLEPGGSLRAPM